VNEEGDDREGNENDASHEVIAVMVVAGPLKETDDANQCKKTSDQRAHPFSPALGVVVDGGPRRPQSQRLQVISLLGGQMQPRGVTAAWRWRMQPFSKQYGRAQAQAVIYLLR